MGTLPDPKEDKMPRPEDDLEEEKAADYRYLKLVGTHLEMGQQLADEIGPLPPVPAKKPLTLSQITFAEECWDVISSFHPTLLDEYEGWAEALDLEMDALLGMLIAGIEGTNLGCSSFALRRQGRTIVGRNYDFFYWARLRYLIAAQPEAYYATLGMNDGLLSGRHDGLNQHGLFVALHGVGSKAPERVEPGVAFHLIPRILLETCATAEEAVMMAQEMPHLSSFNYTIVDPHDMFVVEAYPEMVRVREAENDYIAATNHFLHDDLSPLIESPILENSKRRLQKMLSALSKGNSDPWALAQEILTDHQTPLCGHVDGLATLWSVISDLTNQKVAYSLGAPCRNKYKEYPWPEGKEEEAFLGS